MLDPFRKWKIWGWAASREDENRQTCVPLFASTSMRVRRAVQMASYYPVLVQCAAVLRRSDVCSCTAVCLLRVFNTRCMRRDPKQPNPMLLCALDSWLLRWAADVHNSFLPISFTKNNTLPCFGPRSRWIVYCRFELDSLKIGIMIYSHHFMRVQNLTLKINFYTYHRVLIST